MQVRQISPRSHSPYRPSAETTALALAVPAFGRERPARFRRMRVRQVSPRSHSPHRHLARPPRSHSPPRRRQIPACSRPPHPHSSKITVFPVIATAPLASTPSPRERRRRDLRATGHIPFRRSRPMCGGCGQREFEATARVGSQSLSLDVRSARRGISKEWPRSRSVEFARHASCRCIEEDRPRLAPRRLARPARDAGGGVSDNRPTSRSGVVVSFVAW